jgi:malate dehydrogenase (oxaloacetate-decarboxylating)
VAGPNMITVEMVKSMAPQAMVFAMANPTPEIMPELAKEAGAAIVATGRSDYPNQINNVLAFPGVFKAVIDGRLKQITMEHKLLAVEAIVEMTKAGGELTTEHIVPDPFMPGLAEAVAKRMLARK